MNFHRHPGHGEPEGPDLQVDVHLEEDVTRVRQAADAYLADPGEPQRRRLLSALEALDEQTAASDAYERSIVGSAVYGFTAKGAVIGETGQNPIAEEVRASVFQAQIELVKAARSAVGAPGPSALDALRAASADLHARLPAASSDQSPDGA